MGCYRKGTHLSLAFSSVLTIVAESSPRYRYVLASSYQYIVHIKVLTSHRIHCQRCSRPTVGTLERTGASWAAATLTWTMKKTNWSMKCRCLPAESHCLLSGTTESRYLSRHELSCTEWMSFTSSNDRDRCWIVLPNNKPNL